MSLWGHPYHPLHLPSLFSLVQQATRHSQYSFISPYLLSTMCSVGGGGKHFLKKIYLFLYILIHCRCLQIYQKRVLDPITDGCEPATMWLLGVELGTCG